MMIQCLDRLGRLPVQGGNSFCFLEVTAADMDGIKATKIFRHPFGKGRVFGLGPNCAQCIIGLKLGSCVQIEKIGIETQRKSLRTS